MSPTPVPIILSDVSVRFGATTALSEISCTFAAGTASALVGPNGSGKSTVLRLLADLIRPTSGTIVRPAETPIAFVPQGHDSHRPWMPLTAGEVVRMGRYRRRWLPRPMTDTDHQAIEAATTRAEVADLLRRPFGELSGGQQQRVLMAQALCQEPHLLLLDEPITGLDLASQQRILDLIDEEVDAGTTVVVSTHNLDEARHCQQVLLLAGDSWPVAHPMRYSRLLA